MNRLENLSSYSGLLLTSVITGIDELKDLLNIDVRIYEEFDLKNDVSLVKTLIFITELSEPLKPKINKINFEIIKL